MTILKGGVMIQKERRKNYPMPEEDMYKLSDIQNFIEKERRHDERSRLNEVQKQKLVWNRVITACVLLNSLFLILALIGYVYND